MATELVMVAGSVPLLHAVWKDGNPLMVAAASSFEGALSSEAQGWAALEPTCVVQVVAGASCKLARAELLRRRRPDARLPMA